MDLPTVGWLPWRPALAVAVLLLVVGLVIDVVRRRSSGATARLESAAVVAREAALVLTLYASWQFVGSLSVGGVDQAEAAGTWLADVEAALGWPTEASIQQAVLGHELLIRAADLYYASVHVPVLVATLAWVLLLRRAYWPFTRTLVAILTGLCLAIQFAPVAPPRLLPALGIVDTAAADGLSVYALAHGANEYSAMPSIHIAWASAVALIAVVVVRGPWRWLALLYPVVTSWVVVVTGNHFIIDGVAAVLLLGVAVAATLALPSQRPPAAIRSAATPTRPR